LHSDIDFTFYIQYISNMSNKLAYTAGIFDGEGSILISVNRPHPKRETINPQHYLTACLGNTNRPLIDWLKSEFGGHIVKGGNRQAKRQQEYWIWSISSCQARDFLTLIYPYLRIKKEQARLGIEFQNRRLKKGSPGKRCCRWGLTSEELSKRAWYKEQISSLNGLTASLSKAIDINL